MITERILIVYGTKFGQTAKIAEHIANVLTRKGFEVTLAKGDAIAPTFSFAPYDGVVVGASIIGGRHQRYIERFVRRYRRELDAVPCAFFSVSGSAASPSPKGQAEALRLVETFVSATGWRPRMSATIAGAIKYTKYNPILRWFMKRIVRSQGGPTDTSRDHEHTDWARVDRFAVEFAESVSTRGAPAATTG
jgi:menaquinone-dependent protoporphyrinogen oxidase